MDELKLLIEAVAGLPTITSWVLVGFLTYKLAVVGSIYGVIRYAIEKFVEWRSVPVHKRVNVTAEILGLCIRHDGTFERLVSELHRLLGKGVGIKTQYIHSASVQWLAEAISEKEAREREASKAK